MATVMTMSVFCPIEFSLCQERHIEAVFSSRNSKRGHFSKRVALFVGLSMHLCVPVWLQVQLRLIVTSPHGSTWLDQDALAQIYSE